MVNEKIPRVTGKIFASNAAEGDIGQFGSALTGTKVTTDDISIIQALPAYEEGWRGAVVSDRNYPTLQEMNGLQKTFSQQIAYLLQNGMPEWDPGTTYFTDQFCRIGSNFYVSLQDNNLGNNPTTTTGFWAVWYPGEGNFANVDLTNLSVSGQAILDNKLNKSQVTNCILEVASTPSITAQSHSSAAYVNHGATIQDNAASGFSADNFILLNKTFTDSTTFDFEIVINTTDLTGIQILAAINNYDNSIGLNNGILFIRYNGEQLNGNTQIPTGQNVTIKLSRTTTGGYTLSYKTTGGYIEQVVLPSNAGYFAGKSIYLGSRNGYYFKGTINLAGTQITADSSIYWNNSTLLDFQTAEIQATLNLLMPNGRNNDGTLNNIEDTLTITDTLLYLPTGGEKTILVKQNGEIMIRDYYLESLSEPEQAPLSGVWFNTNDSVLNEQLATYPNFINTGAEIEEGIVTINSATGYIQLPSNYDLGENWSISLPINLAASNHGVVIGNMAVDSSGAIQYLPDAIGVYYDGTNLNAYFRRSDVYQVQKDGTTIGYTKTEGVESTLVAADTIIYSNINCTNVQATATGSDYIYTGVTSPSLIGTLSVPYAGGEEITLDMAYNGSQYSFNSQTLNSSDNVRNNAIITLGGTNETVSTSISGTLNLNTAALSFWQWNEISDSASDYISFIGARIGKTQDNGTTIERLRLDKPVTIANALYCANTTLDNLSISSGFRKLIKFYNKDRSFYKIFREIDSTNGEEKYWCEQGGNIQTQGYFVNINLLVECIYERSNMLTTHNGTNAWACGQLIDNNTAILACSATNAWVVWQAYGEVSKEVVDGL